MKALAALRSNRYLSSDRTLISACNLVERKFTAVTGDVAEILEMFRVRTENMWAQMSKGSLQRMERLITDYQYQVGGALCLMTVKMDAWTDRFPHEDIGGPMRRADFIMNTMCRGLDRVHRIQCNIAT